MAKGETYKGEGARWSCTIVVREIGKAEGRKRKRIIQSIDCRRLSEENIQGPPYRSTLPGVKGMLLGADLGKLTRRGGCSEKKCKRVKNTSLGLHSYRNFFRIIPERNGSQRRRRIVIVPEPQG